MESSFAQENRRAVMLMQRGESVQAMDVLRTTLLALHAMTSNQSSVRNLRDGAEEEKQDAVEERDEVLMKSVRVEIPSIPKLQKLQPMAVYNHAFLLPESHPILQTRYV